MSRAVALRGRAVVLSNGRSRQKRGNQRRARVRHARNVAKLDCYVNEATWRYNRREADEGAGQFDDRRNRRGTPAVYRDDQLMAKRKKLFHLDMSFEEALRRYVQTDPKELADMIEEAKRAGENVEKFIEERIGSIRRGARRAPKRFRL